MGKNAVKCPSQRNGIKPASALKCGINPLLLGGTIHFSHTLNHKKNQLKEPKAVFASQGPGCGEMMFQLSLELALIVIRSY
jgi:hypothetical protein